MRKFTLLLIGVLGCQILLAQSRGQGITWPRSMGARDTLDWAEVCIHYRQTARIDTLTPTKFTFSEMMLLIGHNLSEYTNYTCFWSDSIMAYQLAHTDISSPIIIDQAVARTRGSGDDQEIFKNYPQGRYTVQDRVVLDRYIYEEEIPHFNWKLEPGTSKWLEYTCRKATCTFRGRHYTAWYALEIPLNNGPWKFNGLPGLILKAEDSKGDYVFEATEIYKVTWKRPIYHSKRTSEFKTTREKFLKAQKRDLENPFVALKNSGKAQVSDADATIIKKRSYNPIELTE